MTKKGFSTSFRKQELKRKMQNQGSDYAVAQQRRFQGKGLKTAQPPLDTEGRKRVKAILEEFKMEIE